jgi:hypothetical protein
VRFQEHPEFIRLVEERSVKAGFRSELLHSPDRLYADIKKSNISEAGMKKIAVDNGHLLAIQGGRVYGYTSSNVCELDGVDKIAKYEMYAENNAANVIPDIYNTEVTGAVRKTERKPSIDAEKPEAESDQEDGKGLLRWIANLFRKKAEPAIIAAKEKADIQKSKKHMNKAEKESSKVDRKAAEVQGVEKEEDTNQPVIQRKIISLSSPARMTASEKIRKDFQTANLLSNALCDQAVYTKELVSFSKKEKAERFVQGLENIDHTFHICRDSTPDGDTAYKVFVMDTMEVAQAPVMPEEKSRQSTDLQIPEQPAAETEPWIAGDVFEKKRRHVFPFVSVTLMYTDNVFNTKREEESDFITVISPGIWLTVPHSKDKLALINSSTISPGGYIVENLSYEFFRRFQAYLFYQADIEFFSRHSEEDFVKHRARAYLGARFRGGLSLELQDEFLKSRDDRGTGVSFASEEFYSNLFSAVVTYDPGRKIWLRGAYTHFFVNYDSSVNSFRKRRDNAFSAEVLYKIRPKTSIFAEYKYIDVNYTEGNSLDSKEHHVYGGVRWKVTAKTEGVLKAGYGKKRFRSGIKSNKDFILEAHVNHRLTAKGTLALKAWRKTNETNIAVADYLFSHGISLGYTHRITSKISGLLNASYIRDDYEGAVTIDNMTREREDKYFRAGIAIRYEYRRWLNTDVGYIYSERDSNFSEFDYSNNTFYFRINSAI